MHDTKSYWHEQWAFISHMLPDWVDLPWTTDWVLFLPKPFIYFEIVVDLSTYLCGNSKNMRH